ncbi:stress protein [Rhodococcus rhodochrous]|uniref:TerD family protein n=1 Tax=Rhodococcus rhodochrous TaxID=1829 RepID=UPI000D07ECB1|nr:TerD family protein [Rhodococcus rhodochrous]AYA24742.1 stress protein [Rhodococcus rhodochrous]
MAEVAKGSKTDLTDLRYEVRLGAAVDGAVDLMAVLLTDAGRVRSDDDFVFFNNPKAPGVHLTSDTSVTVDLSAVPADVQRVLVAASTEAQGRTFGEVPGVRVEVRGPGQLLEFVPPGLATETVLQVVALYRRGSGWRLDAVGQGYQDGLAAFATDHGIVVDDTDDEPEPTVSAPKTSPAASPISFEKVQISLTKDSPTQTARIDLRKSQGDPNWVLTVGLEWDGRGATYDRNGNVKKYGSGDLDVYFYCRNEDTNDYVVISGDPGHRGSLDTWPYIHHYGDSKGPGNGKKPAVEQVRVLPNENGDLLVNIYQSVDNGAGAIDKFGKPRVAIRYGRAGHNGLPGPDADEILVYVGNGKNSYWATVAHIDVQDGVLTVDGETRYSRFGSERMPGLDSSGTWVRSPEGGPTGRSKKRNGGLGLDRYAGTCPK